MGVCRSFLRNHLPDMAAIDMFVVATATFRLPAGAKAQGKGYFW